MCNILYALDENMEKIANYNKHYASQSDLEKLSRSWHDCLSLWLLGQLHYITQQPEALNLGTVQATNHPAGMNE